MALQAAAQPGSFSHHGGRLSAAYAAYPQAPSPWVDLSTGINPHIYPAPRASKTQRARLPDRAELARLEAAAARAFDVEDPRCVVAIAGTELAIRLLPQVLELRYARIVEPTYGSHADAWRRAGAGVESVSRDQIDEVRPQCALTIVNPNNPDGAVLEPGRILPICERVSITGGALIVDESFCELQPQISVAAAAGTDPRRRLIVLRSFGKFYGLAGVRLGFVVCVMPLAQRLRGLLGDWPVSADALAAGAAAYSDVEWARRMRARLQREARQLDRLLATAGFHILGGTSLYRLCRSDNARERFEALARAGILVRPFAHDPRLLRFGLPGGPQAWARLKTVLAAMR